MSFLRKLNFGPILFIGVHWTYVRLRLCRDAGSIEKPLNNADSKVYLAKEDMQILHKFHVKVTSKAHSILAYSIFPLPWVDEATGSKLPGRLIDVVIADEGLRKMYISMLRDKTVLGVRNRDDHTPLTRRPMMKRSRTEELCVFRSVSENGEAMYENSVTRDIESIYSHLNQDRLFFYMVRVITSKYMSR